MDFTLPVEVLEGALGTVKGFVHKPSSDISMLGLSAVNITASKEHDSLTLLGNSQSQKLSFDIAAKVKKSGEVLTSVADLITALSTISNKQADVRVSLGDNALQLETSTVSVSVPTFDLDTMRVKPTPPARHEGELLSLSFPAADLAEVYARALPGAVDSPFPHIIMWVDGEELALLGTAALGASFASVPGAKVDGDIDLVLWEANNMQGGAGSDGGGDLVLWEASNLRRIMDLAAHAETVVLTHDTGRDGEPAPFFTVTIKSGDTTFVVQQAMERAADTYPMVREKLVKRAHSILDNITTTVTVKNGDILRRLESAEKIRPIGRDSENSLTTRLEIRDDALEVSLVDGTFSEEFSSVKTTGETGRVVNINSKVAVGILSALGSEAKVTLHFPADPDGEGAKTGFLVITCQDSDLSPRSPSLPVSGYWALASFRSARR